MISEDSALLLDKPLPEREWTEEETALIAWFQEVRDTLPLNPLRLAAGLHVFAPLVFYRGIERAIEAGPGMIYARSGRLEADLRALREARRQ